MKKKIWIIFIIVLIFFSYSFNKVEASVVTEKNASKILLYINGGDSLSNKIIIESLKNDFGYNKEKLYKPLIIDTTVTIVEADSKGYKIKLGNKEIAYYISENDIRDVYGYDKSFGINLEKGAMWFVTIEANTIPLNYNYGWNGTNQTRSYQINASKLWSYKDAVDRPQEIENDENTQQEVYVYEQKSVGDTVEEVIDGAKQIKAWLEEFGRDQVGTMIKAICKGIRRIFDSLQAEINKFKTLQDGIPEESELKIMYSYEELSGENVKTGGDDEQEDSIDYTMMDKYTKVSEFNNESKEWQRIAYIENDEETQGFSRKKVEKDKETDVDKIVNEGTNIPVIPVELYGIAIGNVDIFSVDFINGASRGNSSGLWNGLRKIFSLIVHISLYLSMAILLMTLIYHGLSIVYGSINPRKRADHMEGLKRFAFSLSILVGTIIFMALCTYGSHVFFDIVKMTDENGNITDELPIRVNVNDVFSFSTNVTGYYRFLSLSKNASVQFTNTIIYAVLVIFNFGFAIGMFVRMFVVWFLSIIGPLLASAKALNIENKIPINYETWLKWYFKLSLVQIIIAAFYRVLLECTV